MYVCEGCGEVWRTWAAAYDCDACKRNTGPCCCAINYKCKDEVPDFHTLPRKIRKIFKDGDDHTICKDCANGSKVTGKYIVKYELYSCSSSSSEESISEDGIPDLVGTGGIEEGKAGTQGSHSHASVRVQDETFPRSTSPDV